MSAAPMPSEEKRSLVEDEKAGVNHASREDRRDREPSVQSGQPGAADVNPGQQSRYGNLKQNLTNRWQVQDR